jgi:hypothetical protein
MAFIISVFAVAIGVWLPGMAGSLPRALMAGGLGCSIAALGCAMAAWQYVSAWSADAQAALTGPPRPGTANAAPWLLLISLALTAASLLSAL